MKRFVTTIITLISLCLLNQASAQGDEINFREITIRTMGWEKITQKLYVKKRANNPNSEYIPIQTFKMAASHDLRVVVGNSLAIYKQEVVNDEVKHVVVAKTKISNDCRRWLVILFPYDKNKLRYPCKAIKDDPNAAPFGGYQLFNFSNLNLKGGLHKRGFSLKPNGSVLLKPEVAQREQLNFAIWYIDEKGKKKWLERNSWIHNNAKHLRYFLLVKRDKNGRLRAQSRALPTFRSEDPAPTGGVQ